MPTDGRITSDPTANSLNDPLQNATQRRAADFQLPELVRDNPQMPQGARRRQLMRWRVPGAGFIDMYLNPQQLQIQERKVIKRTRTKGGYVVQYWGEELPVLNITGTTGSAGIEGINILRSVYRAEQDAFESVAKTLADRLGSFSIGGSVGGLIGATTTSAAGAAVGNAISGLMGANQSAPLLPTLASLAVAVELFFQGWVFKGYFENFTVTESVSLGPGVFEYSLTFYVTDRRGVRYNWSPWHRSPADQDASGGYKNFRKSDSAVTPPSFKGEA